MDLKSRNRGVGKGRDVAVSSQGISLVDTPLWTRLPGGVGAFRVALYPFKVD